MQSSGLYLMTKNDFEELFGKAGRFEYVDEGSWDLRGAFSLS